MGGGNASRQDTNGLTRHGRSVTGHAVITQHAMPLPPERPGEAQHRIRVGRPADQHQPRRRHHFLQQFPGLPGDETGALRVRHQQQAAALEDILVERGGVKVIALVVHADEVIRRLATRGRDDDDAWVIKERLAVYSRETEPVLEFYRRRGVVTILDGNRPMEEVSEAIEASVGSARN